MREVIAQPVEDVFCLEIPERLELQPFADVFLKLLDLILDQREWPLQCCVRESSELDPNTSANSEVRHELDLLVRCTSSLRRCCLAFANRSRTANSESAGAGKQYLDYVEIKICQSTGAQHAYRANHATAGSMSCARTQLVGQGR